MSQDNETKTVAEEYETVCANDVAKNFKHFLDSYDYWRKLNGLSASIDNVHEIISAMTDKLGRIARQVKHQERNDPKPDWPKGMTEEMAGLMVYMIILKNYYDVDITEGIKGELNKAVEQHSKKEEESHGDVPASIIKAVSLIIRDAVRSGAETISFTYSNDLDYVAVVTKGGSVLRTEKIPYAPIQVVGRIFIMAGLSFMTAKTEKQKGVIEVRIDDVPFECMVESHPISEQSVPFIEMTIKKAGE